MFNAIQHYSEARLEEYIANIGRDVQAAGGRYLAAVMVGCAKDDPFDIDAQSAWSDLHDLNNQMGQIQSILRDRPVAKALELRIQERRRLILAVAEVLKPL